MADWVEYVANPEHSAWDGAAPAYIWRTDGQYWERLYDDGWDRALNWNRDVVSGALIPRQPIDTPHTPADLAMALELADILSNEDFFCDWNATMDIWVSSWLRAQVIAALYGMEAR